MFLLKPRNVQKANSWVGHGRRGSPMAQHFSASSSPWFGAEICEHMKPRPSPHNHVKKLRDAQPHGRRACGQECPSEKMCVSFSQLRKQWEEWSRHFLLLTYFFCQLCLIEGPRGEVVTQCKVSLQPFLYYQPISPAQKLEISLQERSIETIRDTTALSHPCHPW